MLSARTGPPDSSAAVSCSALSGPPGLADVLDAHAALFEREPRVGVARELVGAEQQPIALRQRSPCASSIIPKLVLVVTAISSAGRPSACPAALPDRVGYEKKASNGISDGVACSARPRLLRRAPRGQRRVGAAVQIHLASGNLEILFARSDTCHIEAIR